MFGVISYDPSRWLGGGRSTEKVLLFVSCLIICLFFFVLGNRGPSGIDAMYPAEKPPPAGIPQIDRGPPLRFVLIVADSIALN